MPDFHKYSEVSLDEAIQYYNDYYERVKNTSSIKWYTNELYFFINPMFNDEYIENLNKQIFKITVDKSINFDYRIRFRYTEENGTILTNFQIQELKKFNEYLKTPIAKKYILSREKF